MKRGRKLKKSLKFEIQKSLKFRREWEGLETGK